MIFLHEQYPKWFAPPHIPLKEVWQQVQDRLAKRGNTGKSKAIETYALSGKIICDKCGSTFVGHRSTGRHGHTIRYYVCGNKYRTRTCDAKNFNADVLEAEIVLQLKAWLQTLNVEEYLDLLEEELHKYKPNDNKALYEELRGLEPKIKRATLLILEDSRLESVKDNLIVMQTRKSEIEELLKHSDKIEVDRTYIKFKLEQHIENLDNINAITLLQELIKEIHTLDGEFTVIGGVYNDGSPGGIWTYDISVNSRTLLPLSYRGLLLNFSHFYSKLIKWTLKVYFFI